MTQFEASRAAAGPSQLATSSSRQYYSTDHQQQQSYQPTQLQSYRGPSSSSGFPSSQVDPRSLTITNSRFFAPPDQTHAASPSRPVLSGRQSSSAHVSGNGSFVNGVEYGEVSDEEDAEDDDASDDISTSSGRRHGNLLQPEPEDYVVTESPYITHWFSKRHRTGGNPKPRSPLDLPDWRMRERLRTVTAALVMCLNIGVDPPDISKTNPCSKLLCWMDPSSLEVSKALPAIGKNLQAQFETLSMKTRYKQYLDPIVEETKRFCTALRRTAKDERVLFYYNGYGVPKPTPGGEIWVFNKAYTQYIPVTLYDLQAWLGNPCIFVWDASAAGNVVVNFKKMAERRNEEEAKASGGQRERLTIEGEHFPLRESIHLAACGPDEILPMNPDLPADLFTCCLTSPIEISLRWFVLQNPLPSKLNVDMVMNIPGRLQDRRTPLGELNWIFTAITDTIAWTVLPRPIFRRLFRDDLMVAALLRNYLLAERIMRFYHCTPMSHPKLPTTHNHPLWNSWDLAVDQCLSQLPTLLEKEKAQREADEGGPPMDPKLAAFEYKHSSFFTEQLKAFEVWLHQGGVSRSSRRKRGESALVNQSEAQDEEDEDEDEQIKRKFLDPPDQLPIVLQVLLSQVHRLRALLLLSQFLDLGPRAVNLALSIGIFPYVLKLLQSPAVDLKPVLIYIWARILAVDRSCQNDLLRDSGYVYFVGVLSPFQQPPGSSGQGTSSNALPIPNISEHRSMCAFIIAVFCQDFPAGQQACLTQTDAMDACLEHLEDDDSYLRQWSALCMAQLWDGNDESKAMGIKKDAHGKLCYMLGDVSPEVRAAVLYALGTLLGTSGSSQDHFDPVTSMSNPSGTSSRQSGPSRYRCFGTGSLLGNMEESAHRSLEIGIAIAMLSTRGDCSPMVRKELVISLSALVREYKGHFVLAAYLYYADEERRLKQARKQAREASRTSLGALDVVNETVGQPAQKPSSYRDESSEPEDATLARVVAKLILEEDFTEEDVANVPAFVTLYASLLDLTTDSYCEVSGLAKTVVDYINALLLESEVARASESIVKKVLITDGVTSNRFVQPTSTAASDEGYFSFTPPLSNGVSASEGLVSPHGTAYGQHNSGTHTPTRQVPHPRRTPSLAQTVKTIATLGYSRPPSPDPSPDTGSPLELPIGVSAYNPATRPRIPAPRFNVMGYTSPFSTDKSHAAAGSASPQAAASSPASPSASATALLARRSASAESLAHIARRQAQQQAGKTSSGASSGLNTPTAAHKGDGEGNDSAQDLEAPSFQIEEADIKVADALAALISIDLTRFRNRSALALEGSSSMPSSAGSTPLPSPNNSRTAMNTLLTDPGLGNDDITETLPLKSRLFSWCSERYREPQLKDREMQEPGSVTYNTQTWKRQRNERIVIESQAETEQATRSSWNQPVSTMRNGAPPYSMLMHQFENHLVTASERDVISVWDWEKANLLSRFHNGNPVGTNISSMLFVNEEVDGLLVVGSAEGDVRIYRHYDRPTWIPQTKGPELLSTFRALPDLVRSRFPSGLVVDWQQVTGHMLAGGDSRVLRVWDAHRELCVCDIPTRTSSCVTSISSESDIGHIFVAGFGNGTVGVYDRRNPPEASLVRLWEEHSAWIHKVHLQKHGNRELVSASDDGEVRLWDIRGRSSISKANLGGQLRGKLSAFAVHERAPVFAAASTPRPTATGSTPQHILHASFAEPLRPLGGASTPIVRHFSSHHSHSSGSSNHQSHHQNHHSTHGGSHQPHAAPQKVLPPAVLDAPLSGFTPAMAALTFHPHWHLFAYSGPDLTGTVEVKRLPSDKSFGQRRSEVDGLGSGIEGNATIPSLAETESTDHQGGTAGTGGSLGFKRSMSFLGV